MGLATRVYSAVFILVGLTYLLWRTTIVGSGWLLALSVPLLWAETWAWLQIVCLRHQVVPGRADRNAGDVTLTVSPLHFETVVSIRAGTTETELERTMVGLAAMGCDGAVTVLGTTANLPRSGAADDPLDVSYASAGSSGQPVPSLDAVVAQTSAPWVLWLEAGQVPMPGLPAALQALAADDRTAVCQFASGLLNPESMAHANRGGDEEALEHLAIGDGLAARGCAPWHGPGSLVRRAAVEQLVSQELNDEGRAGDDGDGGSTVARRSVELLRDGWRIDYESRPLIRVPAADSLRPYLSRRRDRSLATLEQLGYAFGLRGVPWHVRRALLARAVSVTHGLRQLGMIVLLSAALIAGVLPVADSSGPVLAGMAAYAGLAMLARRALSGGAMGLGDWVRHGWRTVGADLAALLPRFGTPSAGGPLDRAMVGDRGLSGRMQLPILAFIGLQVALAARTLTVVRPTPLPDMTRSDSAVLILLATMVTVQLIDVLGGLTRTRGRRRSPRLPLKSDISLGTFWGRTFDVSPLGVGAIVDVAPPVGEQAEVTFAIGDTDGSEHLIRAGGVVRSAASHRSGLVRVGVEFESMDDDHRLALTRYCALGVAQPPAGDPAPTERPESLVVDRSGGDLTLVRALAVFSVMSASGGLFVGPAADPVVAADNGVTAIPELITVTGVDGADPGNNQSDPPQLTVRTHTDAWSEPWGVDANGEFIRPTGPPSWPGPVHVEVAVGLNRFVLSAAEAEAGVELAAVTVAPEVAAVELIGPSGSAAPAVDGDVLVPGRYTVKGRVAESGESTVTKIEVGQGVELVVAADGTASTTSTTEEPVDAQDGTP